MVKGMVALLNDIIFTMGTIARFLGNGLVTADYELWKPKRKVYDPAFNRR